MMQEDWEKSLVFNRTFRYFHNTLLKYQIRQGAAFLPAG